MSEPLFKESNRNVQSLQSNTEGWTTDTGRDNCRRLQEDPEPELQRSPGTDCWGGGKPYLGRLPENSGGLSLYQLYLDMSSSSGTCCVSLIFTVSYKDHSQKLSLRHLIISKDNSFIFD